MKPTISKTALIYRIKDRVANLQRLREDLAVQLRCVDAQLVAVIDLRDDVELHFREDEAPPLPIAPMLDTNG